MSPMTSTLQPSNHVTPTTPTPTALVASRVAVSLFGLMAVIQVGIAVGIFPVTIVWGGSQKQRTWQNSLASVAAAAILLGMAWIIHSRAKVPDTAEQRPSLSLRVTSWMIAGYMMLNTLGNSLSPSFVERYVFGCMTAVLAICSLIVASSPISSAQVDTEQRRNYESIA